MKQIIRYKKIRGKQKILRRIDDWAALNCELNLAYLEQYKRDYVKFWVKPFSNLNVGNSIYPEPYGEFKEKLLYGLFEIYHAWKMQLDELGKPYYLKIWLFEKKISRSQVVCAVDECLDFYDNIFANIKNVSIDELKLAFNHDLDNFSKLNWQQGVDVGSVENNYLDMFDDKNSQEYRQAERWFHQVKEQAFDVYHVPNPSDVAFYYLIENDRVWIGG